ncbi:MAG: tetratricopeptide repeat protein [Candidatus Aureabacteria bacterium]|nr:tetratricopeptide repeat protein [Candidatus Auribacterota bacterium]
MNAKSPIANSDGGRITPQNGGVNKRVRACARDPRSIIFLILFASSGRLTAFPDSQDVAPDPSPSASGLSVSSQGKSSCSPSVLPGTTPKEAIASTVAVIAFSKTDKKESRDWLSRELADSLIEKLHTSCAVNIRPTDRVRTRENNLKGKPSGVMHLDEAADIARLTGADIILVGNYQFMGNDLCAEVRSLRPDRSEEKGPIRLRGPADRIGELEGRLALSVAKLIGLSMNDAQREKIMACQTLNPVAFEELCKGKQAPEGSHRRIQHLQRAIQADPSCAEAHYLLGTTYYGIGVTYQYVEWYEKAIEEYRKAAALTPNSAKIYCGLGLVYMLMGRYELTKSSMERALALDPDMKLARAYLNRLKSMGF